MPKVGSYGIHSSAQDPLTHEDTEFEIKGFQLP